MTDPYLWHGIDHKPIPGIEPIPPRILERIRRAREEAEDEINNINLEDVNLEDCIEY